MWIISTVECNTVIRSKRNLQDNGWKPVVESPLNLNNAEVIHNDDGMDDGPLYITHMELENDKRARRDSAFDRGYDEFLRNYHKDNQNGAERRGRYQVKESDESSSDESSSTSDADDDDDDESESNESDEKRKKYSTKSNGKNKKAEQAAPKKKSKHCKTEKRGNMLCNICYDPKNDGKAESCSYNSDPKEKSYENSYDTSYSNRDGDKEHESLEEGDDEDESSESEVKKKPPPVKKRPINHHQPPPPHGPRYYPPFLRPYPKQNYGPQTFLPQSFQPISLSTNGRRPIRIQIKNSPERNLHRTQPVALIRYRTVESPFGSQHIRLIMENSHFGYPSGPPPFANGPPQNHQNRQQQQQQQQHYNRRPVPAAQEYRPPRDINGAHSESLVSNVTKEHQFEFVPKSVGHSSNREYAAFISKDWSRCEKSVENDQVCFECYVDGERRKECMFATVNQQPDNFYKSYSTSKKFSTNHPYSFDVPTPSVSKHIKHSEQNTKSHSSRKNNKQKNENNENNDNGDYSVEHFGGNGGSDERFHIDLKSENYENHPNATNDWDFNNDAKQERPQTQPLRSSGAGVIYGKAKPGPEPLALFFATDPRIIVNNSSNNSTKNYKNDDDEHIETTTASINKHTNSNKKTNRNKTKTTKAPNNAAKSI